MILEFPWTINSDLKREMKGKYILYAFFNNNEYYFIGEDESKLDLLQKGKSGDQLHVWLFDKLQRRKFFRDGLMQKMRVCIFCETPFKSKDPKRVYCSDKCRWKMWDFRHPRNPS